jgi:ligand-binding sensor domain-containing protein/signal transduction histidine kinase/DNA-binding response OmpR family regulator
VLYLSKKIFIVCLIVVLSDCVFNQTKNFRFEHITIDNGLSNNQISNILQDKKGFIWICTQDGVNRYDGHTFKQFRHNTSGNTNSLSDYAASHILESSKGLFWISTRDGLNIYDPVKEKFTHLKPIKGNQNSLISEKLIITAEDRLGNIWAGTRNGLNRYDPQKKIFKSFFNDPADKKSLSFNYISALFSDSKGNLWVGTKNGLNLFNYKTNNFNVYFHNAQDPKSICGNYITRFVEDSKGNIWIGTNKGLSRIAKQNSGDIEFINYQNNPVNNYSLSSNNIVAIDEDSKGNLWIGTIGGGVNVFNPLTNKFLSFKHLPEDIYSISENDISALLVDKFDDVWIGTYSKGLNKFSPTKERFALFQPFPFSITKAENNNITSVLVDNQQNLWIGTNGDGIKVYNKKFLYNESNLLFELNADSKSKNNLSGNSITSIIQDKNGFIWIATFGEGLNKFDPKTKKLEVFKFNRDNPNSISHNYIHTIYEDSKGTIWVGTGLGGLNRFDKSTNTFKRFKDNPKFPDDPKYLNSPEVTAICEDKEGFLWSGTTTGGLNRLDTKTETFIHFQHKQEDVKSISSNRIVCIYLDKKGRLWIGTFSGGLNLYDKQKKSFIHFLEKDGLAGNTIQAITEDDYGNLWLTTESGVSSFDTEKKIFKNYDVNDGLQGKEFNPNCVFNDFVSGKLYFGGVNGLNIYLPNSIKEIKTKPAIVITDFKIFNQSVFVDDKLLITESPTFAKEISLQFDQNEFSFEFAALDFTSPQKNQYAYMLKGFDEDWIYCGNKHEATYTNLNPGKYIFKVKGTNSDGIWNEDGLSLSLIIKPPFWKTWWAYIIYFILASAAFVAIRRYELNRVKLKNDLKLKEFESKNLLEVDQMKSRFFANISHEFRTPLTIIFGSLEKLKSMMENSSNQKDFILMKRNASRLLQLINQLLELSKIESGNVKLNVESGDLIKFLKRVVTSFSSLAFQKNLYLTFNGIAVEDVVLNDKLLLFFDKKKLETIFYNLLSNAIKFSPNGESVDVRILNDDNFVKISFLNSGVEIPVEKISKIFDRFYQVDDSRSRNFEGTGIGLSLVKEFIELHKGKIEVDSGNNRTVFTIYLPLVKVDLNKNEIDSQENLDSDFLIENFDTNLQMLSTSLIVNELPDYDKTIILLVEDNFDLREMIKEILSDNYFVMEAENGVNGLKLAEEVIPDLIITDIMMPQMDGYELSRKLKTIEKTNHIPIILLTAKAATEDKLEGLEIGADDYLIKPFNPDELLIRVKNLIKIRKQMREKYQSQMLIKSSDVAVPSTQKIFIDKLTAIIEKNISNENFSVEILCEEIGMSRSQLHRKLKAITNQSTSEFIRNFKLQRAAELLKQDVGNIAEISYQVGFSSQAYFTKTFQEVYKQTPLEYKKQHSK